MLLIPASGCANSPNAVTDNQAFWASYQTGAQEVNPANDLEDLVKRSSLVVIGTIKDITKGPSTEVGIPAELRMSTLHVNVTEVLEGTLEAKSVKVAMPLLVDSPDAFQVPPESPTMFFLTPAGYGDYYVTSAVAGIVTTQGSKLQTAIDPTQSDNVLPKDDTSIADLAESVKDAE